MAEETTTELAKEEEPVVIGTLFLTLVFLMMIFGFWILFYITLLDR
ncbi:MAG: cytochrome c oxidase subunit 2A [Rhodothermia bacterium]|nr:cytochrome c oxidase subunit 2A [Rhodothermia bacterium]